MDDASSSSSSSSSIEHGMEDMMLSDSIQIGDKKLVDQWDDPPRKSTKSTTREFAKTSALPTGNPTTNPTRFLGPPTQPVTLAESTIFSTVNEQNFGHATTTKQSANASFVPSKDKDGATDCMEGATPVCYAKTCTDSERVHGNNSIVGAKEKQSVNEENSSVANAEELDRKPSFRLLPKNNSSESFNMSVSATTPPTSSSPPVRDNNDESPDGKKKARKSNKNRPKDGQSSGRWTEEEHQAFLRGLHTYGREWKKVASHIPTRTSAQVRSHAQKYFAKLQKEEDSWAGSFVSAEGGGIAGGPNAVVSRDDASGHGVIGDGTTTVSSSVQANVDRIMANPETVEAEVEDTLRQLRERYEALQRRLEQTSAPHADSPNRKRRSPHPLVLDDHSSVTSLSASLQNEELIALSVLRGGLPAGDGISVGGGSELSNEENMDTGSHQTESTGSKKAKHE